MKFWDLFPGPNAAYALELYERFLRDPSSVDERTRAIFSRWKPEIGQEAPEGRVSGVDVGKIVAAVRLGQAIRERGHLAARLDPLGAPPPGDPSLEPASYGLTDPDLAALPATLIGGPAVERCGDALQAIRFLRTVYMSTTGYDYDHVHDPAEREWLRQAAEARTFHPSVDQHIAEGLLDRLTQVETFERFLHRSFPGKTRFSLEGLDMMVPMLDQMTASAADSGIRNILIGMAHRGRLNVLAHVLNKPYRQILAEFKENVHVTDFSEDLGWTGDVKYHAGARRAIHEQEPAAVIISMAPNPSHLEAVNPVVEGMARAAGTSVDQPGKPIFDNRVTLPILIHGDAAFPGQGIVAETLNLSRIPGYRTGGTIHIIANNQLGYTTSPQAGRSTLYAGDIAKGFEIPIVHVNADDPEACVEAARLSFAYRARFGKDFLIDLIGYRRYGHNEGDEPTFTQPVLYAQIQEHPTVRAVWADRLTAESRVKPDVPAQLQKKWTDQLQQALDSLGEGEEAMEERPKAPPAGAARRVKTSVPLEKLRSLNEELARLPEGFGLHRKLERMVQHRRKAFDEPEEASVDWSLGESLALASVLADGIAVRLTGQDVERGTFSQRHAAFLDTKTGDRYVPLQSIPQARAACEIRNSPLSEAAAVGFEYGYNTQEPGRLVLWEAQYGDFIDGAQVMIDEFLTSARAKWGQTPSLVLLLPHSYEGQGPDHSTARLERFLQLAAETNMRIANCTTAAQYFHLLRRQALLLQTDPLPLIVMTPKSLLRNPLTASRPVELARGGWQPVIDDARALIQPQEITRLLLCSGKIYVDLVSSPLWNENRAVAIARLEQLYPFPADQVQQVVNGYRGLQEVIWVQEEPENMGAWSFVRIRLAGLLEGRLPLHYIGRRPNASPAEGSGARHHLRQQAIVEQAFNLRSHTIEDKVLVLRKG